MWSELTRALDAGAVVAYGATPGWAAWFAAQRAAHELVIVVAADEAAARELEADVRFFLGPLQGLGDAGDLDPVAALPGIDISPYAELSPDRGAIVERVATLYRLTQPALRPRVVVTSAEALARKTLPPGELAARGLAIAKGDAVDRDQVAAALLAGGWSRTPVVDEPGTFALRGGVIDVYAPLAPHPVRIELFGDEVESLRWFDEDSQRTLRQIDRVVLHPVRETVPTGARDVRTRLREYADEIAYPSKATRKLIEQLEAGGVFVGIEGLLPAFHDELVTPAAYVPADARWLVVDPDACRRALSDALIDAETRFGSRTAPRTAGPAPQLAFPPSAHFASELPALASPRRVELSTLEVVGDDDVQKLRLDVDDLRVLRQQLDHARTFGDTEHVAPLAVALQGWRAKNFDVTLAAGSQSRLDRLAGVLEQRGAVWPGLHLVSAAPAHSFASPKDKVAIVTGDLVFGQRTHHAQSQKKRAKDALLGGVSDWSQLAAGDYLVHQRHGVGRYMGLKRLAVGSPPIELDTLHLVYEDGTLYLPVYRVSEVQRYVGAEGHPPKIDKLGGVTWEATQSKVSRTVRALAEELLQLYAQRAALPGFRFPPADDSFRELEATFPFDETPDQDDAIRAVLADMEDGKAMDRLVCGDVGYGKTEVALRAIFRCVQGGKQACVLAPTTVLVEQHFRTMAERFRGFPVNLGKLSRFQSKGEQLDTVKKLAAGGIDVVVGTHRALSADVRFKDLGLLVIDEEQRFGVAHKERIKKTRTQVDVLTLTATPIPRTLHLAMTGMRDLSIIATPPADRRAVRTFVARGEDATIKEAIERELDRGGQVFFITPTIGGFGDRSRREADHRLPNDDRPDRPTVRRQRPRDDDRTIDEWSAYLQALVPKARIGIGHGSLPADQLEKVMLGFVQGELDILIATTIVESGLDIPRANTMFVARADAFGLAQLYQLRGRIGRSKDRAYCYLLVPEPEHITDEARRRLEALQRFTELGAGFQIASQDLEIRGGGELLGAKQSGSIAAVGFDRYVKMLEAAVGELRGTPIHSEVDPELTVDAPGFIPDDYVPDPGQRLELYKRLSAIEDDDELAAVMAEISDRYGPVPGDAVRLGELMGQKAIARKLGALALEISQARVALALPDNTDGQNAGRAALAAGWRRLPDGRYATSPPARQALLAVVARATEPG